MSRNKKISENKTGYDSIEIENSEKTISKNDLNHRWINLIQKYMKITLPLSKSDNNSFSKISRLSHEDEKIPKKKKPKKIPEPLVTAPEVTQDPDDMEKSDKVGSTIEGFKNSSVCVTPHP